MDWKSAAKRLRDKAGSGWEPSPVAEILAQGSGPVFVACSGGADSLFALLHYWTEFAADAPVAGDALICLHFNHALRGEASDEDESFVAEVCRSLEIACVSDRASWEKPDTAVTEDEARQARLAFFRRAIRKRGLSSGLIITGHQSDDIAESMLMRLSRGSGLQGLCAPRYVSRSDDCIRFLRPLLDMSRHEIRDALEKLGIPWREDASNETPNHYRNRLRQSVLPAWEKASDRPIRKGIERSRRLAEEDWISLEAIAENGWFESFDERRVALSREKMCEYPLGIQRRLIYRLVERSGLRTALTATVSDSVLRALSAGEAFSYSISPSLVLEGNERFIRCSGTLQNERKSWSPTRLPIGCRVYLPSGGCLKATLVKVEAALLQRLKSGENDDRRSVFIRMGEKQSASLVVRQMRRDDAFVPHGKTSSRKLTELFVERKVEVIEIAELPVVCAEGGDILWVPGLPPAANMLLGEGNKHALRLTYRD